MSERPTATRHRRLPAPVPLRAPADIRDAIVAVTSEDRRYVAVREEAERLARHEGRALVLYDWDASGILSEPLPTWWSGDGPGARPPGPLGPDQLAKAGRGRIARQVADLQRAGIQAGAWLPRHRGTEALGSWALEHGAAALVVPNDLPDIEMLEPDRHDRDPWATSPTAAIKVVRVVTDAGGPRP